MLNDRRVRHHNDPLDTLGAQTCECALELLGQAGVDSMRLQAQDADGILYLPQRESHGWVAGIAHDANTPYLRNHLDQQLRLFGTQIGREVHKAGDIPAWPRDRKSTRLNSSHLGISYAVFCLKKKRT